VTKSALNGCLKAAGSLDLTIAYMTQLDEAGHKYSDFAELSVDLESLADGDAV
jgi:hypothetical protein